VIEGVQLPQLHVVDAEPGQGGVGGGDEVAPGGVARPAAGGGQHRLGGYHELRAGHDVADEPPDEPLGVAAGVDVGGVDKGAARVGERT
jgi:hypothetical protein